MPITWTAEMDRKLLLAILKVHDFTIDKAKVAEELNTDDQPCTANAIQKRLQAIRAMIKNGSDPEAMPKAKATPRKRGAAAAAEDNGTPTKKGKTAKGKGVKAKAAEDDDDAEGEDGGLGGVKQEGGDGDELEF